MGRVRISLGRPYTWEEFKKEFGPKMEIHNEAKLEAELKKQYDREMAQFRKKEEAVSKITLIPEQEEKAEAKKK